jgi:hypothetical protein
VTAFRNGVHLKINVRPSHAARRHLCSCRREGVAGTFQGFTFRSLLQVVELSHLASTIRGRSQVDPGYCACSTASLTCSDTRARYVRALRACAPIGRSWGAMSLEELAVRTRRDNEQLFNGCIPTEPLRPRTESIL